MKGVMSSQLAQRINMKVMILNEDTVEGVEGWDESFVRRGSNVGDEEHKEQNHTWDGHPSHRLDVAP